MKQSEIADLVKQAGAAAKHAPKNLQEAAFNRVFEALVASHSRQGSVDPKSKKPPATNPAELVVQKLNRTQHSEIRHTASVLENALRVLRAARDDLDIAALSAPQISKVLKDKFRILVSRRGISTALNGAGNYVDRTPDGRSILYQLMAKGEEFLDTHGLKGKAKNNTPATKNRKPKPAVQKATIQKKQASAQEKPKTASKVTKKRKKVRAGPKQALEGLIRNGFFKSAKIMSEIILHMKRVAGHTYKPTDLSPTLLRLLREQKLTRDHNSDGQYEYKQK